MTIITPNVQPVFIKDNGIIGYTRLTTQVAARDGAGTVQTIYTPASNNGSNGALCETIQIMPVGVNTASVLFLYYQDSSAATLRWDLWQELALPAVTAISAVGTITPAATYPLIVPLPQILAPISTDSTAKRGLRLNASGISWGVALGAAIAAGVNVTMWGGRY